MIHLAFSGGLAQGEFDLDRGAFPVYVDKQGNFIWVPEDMGKVFSEKAAKTLDEKPGQITPKGAEQ